jgi:hypothetical protein
MYVSNVNLVLISLKKEQAVVWIAK